MQIDAKARPPLRVEPRPLVLSRSKLALSWSPKSACSHAAIWFFHQEGLLHAAAYYHSWPHKFRIQVYDKSQIYLRRAEAVRSSQGHGFTLLKITRDPVRRMVSIFRHVCRHAVLREQLDNFFDRKTEVTGLSLCEFHNFLRGHKLTVPSSLDVHVCAQYHPVWDLNFDRTITLNIDTHLLNESLNAIEEDIGLPVTRFDKIQQFENVRRSHYAKDIAYSETQAIEHLRFTSAMTTDFPKLALERACRVLGIADDLHSVDFAHVATGDSAGRLAFPVKQELTDSLAPHSVTCSI